MDFTSNLVVRVRARMLSACLVSILMLATVVPSSLASSSAAPPKAYSLGRVFLASVTVRAGDRVNYVSWETSSDSRVSRQLGSIRYSLFRSSSSSAPFDRLPYELGVSGSLVDAVAAPGTYRYYLELRRGTNVLARSPVAANDIVDMSKAVGPAGGTLTAANGDIILDIPQGALASTTLIHVTEVTRGPAMEGAIRTAPYFRFEPDGTVLSAPARATIRYQVPVSQFQVAGTLARYTALATYEASTRTWQAQPTDPYSSSQSFAGYLSHFSYWTGEVVQPHGVPSSAANYCQAICHNLVVSEQNRTPVIPQDKQTCYNCHGNLNSGPPAGSNGPNIQEQFIDEPDQSFEATNSRHPTPEGKLACVRCHTPHRNPARYYKLLYALDADGSMIQPSRDTSSVGSAYCWACHGTSANATIESGDPGYYSRTGGDRKSHMIGTPHETLAAPTPANISCLVCHASHASTSTALIKPSVSGTATADDKTLCFACHPDAVDFYKGKTVYNASAHAPAKCSGCHDPHGSAETGNYVKAYDETPCYSCHTDGVVQNLAISGSALADDIEQAFAFPFDHSLGASLSVPGAGSTLSCHSCHKVHIATGSYRQADENKTPVSRVGDRETVWGDAAGEKTSDYVAGDEIYQKPNGDSFEATALPDYNTYCTDCHNSTYVLYSPNLGRNLRQFNWSAEKHGKGVATNAVPVEVVAPYFDANFGHYVLSCTDCHEAHGSSNNWLLRKTINNSPVTIVNGGGATIIEWDSVCESCHQNVPAVHHAWIGIPPYQYCGTCHGGSMGSYSRCDECHYHGAGDLF